MYYSRRALVLAVLVVCSVVAVPSAVTAAGTTTVDVHADSTSVHENETATYQVVVNNTTDGIGAYTFTAALANGSVGTITAVNYSGDPGQTDTTYGAENDSVQLRAALADTAQTGSVQIAEITVRGDAAGSTGLNLSLSALGDETGESYTVSTLSNATLSVTSSSPPAHTLSITPTNASVSTNSTRTLQITGTNFTDGVGTYEFELGLSDASVATFESVTPAGDPGLENVSVDPATATVSVSLASISEPNPSLASVTLSGAQSGNVTLALSEISVGDQNGSVYRTTESTETTVSVTTPPDSVVGDGQPTDTDGDGTYEDVNGDGSLDAVDVQALFTNRESATVRENSAAFDINGDGTVDVVDVQRLFSTATS